MDKLYSILQSFYQDCISRGYFILPGNTEVLIYNKDEVVTLELIYEGDNKLHIDFLKNNTNSDEFTSELMAIFAESINRDQLVN